MSETRRIADQLRRAFEGGAWHGPAVKEALAEDAGEKAWASLLERLEAGNLELRQAILGFDESQLDRPPGRNRATAYGLMHGVIQHDLYHAGQIAVLKKGARA